MFRKGFKYFALLFFVLSTSASDSHDQTLVPGPDVIVGVLPAMEQYGGPVATQVGLGIGTTSCNNGTIPLNWFELANTDHPVIAQNLYRLSGKFDLTTFEQIGQSWVKHAFFALEGNACGFGCNTSGCQTGTHLCPGCSDPYDVSKNADQFGLGSRAWINPFTGVFPSTAANHSGHVHTDTTHRLLVEANDLTVPLSFYFAEAQYITPQEYAWCEAHPGECNMYNNVSYRQFTVSGTTSFTFSPVGSTVRMAPALMAWQGATIIPIEPAPGIDGRAFIAYRVRPGFVSGTWQYEYAIYNENLDRSIQSFTVPLGCGIELNNIGFHAPPNHPGIANDGTQGNAGYSNAPWTVDQNINSITWSSETFAQNQNANAIRWGTLYNFRFAANRPPQTTDATIGFFKAGTPLTVAIEGPAPDVCTGTPTPTATATPSTTTTPSPTPTVTATATGTPSPTPTPTPCTVTFSEDFDGVIAPSLPSGWVASNPGFGDGTLWVTSTTAPYTAPNAAFIEDQDGISDKILDSPSILIPSTPVLLSFRNNFNTEVSGGIFWDGGVLEVSSPNINGGAFTDITDPAVNGSFIAGGYTGTISTKAHNPLGGRMAWSGNSNGYIYTIANLGPNVSGQAITLRFRIGTDEAVAAPGWHIDAITITSGACPTPTPPPTPPPTPTSTPSPVSPQLLNISTRMLVQTGDLVGIGGFIVTGSATKQVLLRGIGPSLGMFGVPFPLPDPIMELHGPDGSIIFTNDNWRETQEAEIIATGLAPFNDLESAILVKLAPGPYTAVVKGVNNTTGTAIVEVFDLTQSAPSRLANISTRAFVNTGADIIIAGFILGGNNGDQELVLRGVGPSLTDFGVPNVLADPTLELRDHNGALLSTNDNWLDDPAQAAIITAAGLALSNPLESGIAVTLAPGQYTALLAGLSAGTGNGLVEVYDVGPSPTPETSPTPTPSASPTVTPTPSGPCRENWDSVTAPALPAGWVASNPVAGDGTMWVTSTLNPETPPNDIFVPDQDGISDKVLDRHVTIHSASAVMSFRNYYNTEFSDGTCWDGYKLEVSSPNISGGDFLNITDSQVGASFATGGYNCNIGATSLSPGPIQGSEVWAGDSGGYIDTVINLGPNLAGQTVTFRFRMLTDEAVAAPGVRIDDISITDATCP